MVYSNILGVFNIRGVGGGVISGTGVYLSCHVPRELFSGSARGGQQLLRSWKTWQALLERPAFPRPFIDPHLPAGH